MRFGIRLRFALWLLAALLPASIAAIYVIDQIEDEIVATVAADLERVRALEAARIESALEGYREHARNLAAGPHVRDFTTAVVLSVEAGEQSATIGGYDGFAEIDALGRLPLQPLAESLQRKTNASSGEVAALRIQGRNGELLGETPGFDWQPTDSTIVDRSIATGSAIVGNAFRDSTGADRVGVVVPVWDGEGTVVGALVLENDLGPIVDLIGTYEAFGATSEAHLAQPTVTGDAEFITLLRFERDAAFTKVVPADRGLPINHSLAAPAGTTLFAPDYRGEESILAVQTLDETGWGLVVKIDRAEALDPVANHVRALKGVAALGVLGILFGWAAFLDPLARRLRRMADGAQRVASGDYETPLDDRRSDEIGSVAANIDRLATDLVADIAVRTDIEGRLRYQATHDTTTGLYNRQFASSLMRELADPPGGDAALFSVLFLDLDNFKGINDVYGHATGDVVLGVAADRLRSVVGDHGTAARWGGDEFVLILPDTNQAGANNFAAQVQQVMHTPIDTPAGVHRVRASIGVATRKVGESVGQLLHRADESMFDEKLGRSGRRSVSPESVSAVERAIESDGVEVWYQAVVCGAGANVVLDGAEALVRLREPSGELLAPGSFLQDVERSTVGSALDRRVLRTALTQVAEWIQSGRVHPDFRLSVNCSQAMMADATTVSYVMDMLNQVGLQPHNLILEISETSPIVPEAALAEFEQFGVKIAVDDLGQKYSNVDRLIDMGATIAKLDQRWLTNDATPDGEGGNNPAVLEHLVSICDSLGVHIVAEGVETNAQLETLRELGVECYQGYLFAAPLSATDFAGRFFG